LIHVPSGSHGNDADEREHGHDAESQQRMHSGPRGLPRRPRGKAVHATGRRVLLRRSYFLRHSHFYRVVKCLDTRSDFGGERVGGGQSFVGMPAAVIKGSEALLDCSKVLLQLFLDVVDRIHEHAEPCDRLRIEQPRFCDSIWRGRRDARLPVLPILWRE
jgi:hypothetical protein